MEKSRTNESYCGGSGSCPTEFKTGQKDDKWKRKSEWKECSFVYVCQYQQTGTGNKADRPNKPCLERVNQNTQHMCSRLYPTSWGCVCSFKYYPHTTQLKKATASSFFFLNHWPQVYQQDCDSNNSYLCPWQKAALLQHDLQLLIQSQVANICSRQYFW